ncbi:MAG: hypothetical protein BWY74_03907 [Firmicutes bacterium ADurb.Bin419]|nr:MAG: hypothetical protein BWY74_03907 [Firmicutes bacterium ADurb.Bin419]
MNLPGSIKDENAKLTTTIDAKGERHDNLEYTFTLDKDAVGEWEYFNYYNDIENQFDPNSIPDAQYQSWKGLSIYNDGKTIMRMMNDGRPANRTDVSWTKGYLMGIMSGADVVPAYAISTVGGKTFMVMEWKNGDYIRTGNINYYYVFVKTSNTPAAESFDPNITVTKDSNGVIHESMNYKFVMDEYTVGQWEQIDFVASPDDFDGSNITRQKYIEKGTHNFYDDGRMVSYADKSIGTGETKWTKGYIFNMGSQDTISNYKLRILNGKTFMFVEWKNDDYAVRGQKPNYFVYVKTSDTPDPEFAK